MPTVETVDGPLDVDELGLTLIHEHFRATDEAGRIQSPHLYDQQREWDAAMADANAVKAHGVKTVVEPSAMFLTRDAAFSKRVAIAAIFVHEEPPSRRHSSSARPTQLD
jgi:phosphotriesterase-related protein